MANIESKRPNHSVHVSGPFDIIQSLPPVLEEGKTYGQFPHESSIAFYDPKTPQILENEQNLIVNVCGYAVDASSLKDDNVYVLHGRFVPRTDLPEDPTPVVFFDHEQILNIGTKAAYINALAGQINVKAMGFVIERLNVEVPGPKKSKINNLHVVIQHTDYDNLRKDKPSFEIMYIVPGSRLQGKTHGLCQIGRELNVTGIITGYNSSRNMWEVHVNGLEVPSGNLHHAPTPQKDSISASSYLRPNLKKIGAMQSSPPLKAKDTTETTNRGPQNSKETPVRGAETASETLPRGLPPPNPLTSQSSSTELEDGEVHSSTKSPAPEGFSNTYGPKRRVGQILGDAQKRMKTLN